MGDIWRVYKQKGGTQRRKDWRSKIERQGSQRNRVLKVMKGIPGTGKGKEKKISKNIEVFWDGKKLGVHLVLGDKVQ